MTWPEFFGLFWVLHHVYVERHDIWHYEAWHLIDWFWYWVMVLASWWEVFSYSKTLMAVHPRRFGAGAVFLSNNSYQLLYFNGEWHQLQGVKINYKKKKQSLFKNWTFLCGSKGLSVFLSTHTTFECWMMFQNVMWCLISLETSVRCKVLWVKID